MDINVQKKDFSVQREFVLFVFVKRLQRSKEFRVQKIRVTRVPVGQI